jgi:hypothetical protein
MEAMPDEELSTHVLGCNIYGAYILRVYIQRCND